MTDGLKKLPAVFYRTASGGEPVRDRLKKLDQNDRRILGHDVGNAEFGWPVGMPLCRPLGDGLWEVRSNLARGRIARVIFCVYGKPDVELARKRQKEVVR